MNVLVVDDELGLRQTLSLILAEEGHTVATATDGASALVAVAASDPEIILCDIRMPTMDGLTFLERYRAQGGQALVVMMSAYGDDDAALEAIRRGAYDFIPKPFRPDQLLLVVRKAIERERLRHEVAHLRDALQDARGDGEIIGRNPAVRELISLAMRAARHPSTILITGESGTGKELIARLVHQTSPRAKEAFVAVNCAAIPESLLESELFGHAKGAFTGAASARRGLFEEASGGTLFLDEIGELPGVLQVKLLRALQEGEIRRVGDNLARHVDVRLVAATARDLEAEVARETFRSDLYYRLNVVRLHLPPLRERSEDIPELAAHFLAKYGGRAGRPVTEIAPAAMQVLMQHRWPGNIRELENVIERGVVLADRGRIDLAHIPASIRNPEAGASPTQAADGLSIKKQTESLERDLIQRALKVTGGNRTKAAIILELSPRALLYKIRDYGLE